MATSVYFNNYNNVDEQKLYEDLVVEGIRIYGHDMLYLPRSPQGFDPVLNEYQYSNFETVCPIEMYIKNIDSFEGQGQLLSKFGLEIRDQMTLVMSKRSYNEFISPLTQGIKPLEGDCIYIPMLGVLYQINYVNSSPIFYNLGKLNIWELNCDLYEVKSDNFNTGVPAIDNKYKAYPNANDPDYDLESYDDNAQNEAFQNAGNGVIDFSETDPFNGEL